MPNIAWKWTYVLLLLFDFLCLWNTAVVLGCLHFSLYSLLSHTLIGLITGKTKNLLHLGQYLKQTLFAGAALFIYLLLYILTLPLSAKFDFIKS